MPVFGWNQKHLRRFWRWFYQVWGRESSGKFNLVIPSLFTVFFPLFDCSLEMLLFAFWCALASTLLLWKYGVNSWKITKNRSGAVVELYLKKGRLMPTQTKQGKMKTDKEGNQAHEERSGKGRGKEITVGECVCTRVYRDWKVTFSCRDAHIRLLPCSPPFLLFCFFSLLLPLFVRLSRAAKGCGALRRLPPTSHVFSF